MEEAAEADEDEELERGVEEDAAEDWMQKMNQFVALQESCDQTDDPRVKAKLQQRIDATVKEAYRKYKAQQEEDQVVEDVQWVRQELERNQ